MASFCKQCSIQHFGYDQADFKGDSTPTDTAQGLYASALCEGCGPIQVDHEGACISDDCLVHHGTGRSRESLYRTNVVHCKRAKYDVYIGRGNCPVTGKRGEWGNPFSHQSTSVAQFKVATRDEAVSAYRDWLLSQPALVEKAKRELKGKVLACWCAPQNCHGRVLVDIANS